jgi:HAD superfamily hydrolase (TIGR01484 family)
VQSCADDESLDRDEFAVGVASICSVGDSLAGGENDAGNSIGANLCDPRNLGRRPVWGASELRPILRLSAHAPRFIRFEKMVRRRQERVVGRMALGGQGLVSTRLSLFAFDLDGTLAVSKAPITEAMAAGLRGLLDRFDVCVISGGALVQLVSQVVDRLQASDEQLAALHLMPTSGTGYFRFDRSEGTWEPVYVETLPVKTKRRVVAALTDGAKALGYWEPNPFGDVIEDRGSQLTFSALGQKAPPEAKATWDPDGAKKERLRDEVARRLPDLEVRAGGSTSIDVTREGIDKAYGIRRLMEHNFLGPEQLIFYGDKLEPGGNDHAVISTGVLSIAVADPAQTLVSIQSIVATTPTRPDESSASTRQSKLPVEGLSSDVRRVIARPFLPSSQTRLDSGLVRRLCGLADDEVDRLLARVMERFDHRHLDLNGVLEKNFDFVACGADELKWLSQSRRRLLGAYYTQEFTLESAALTNPSIVAAPDQSGLRDGEVRVVLSVRSIGEGHLSAIQFRSAVVDADGVVFGDPASHFAVTGHHEPPLFDKEAFREKLEDMNVVDEVASLVIGRLPDRFELVQLNEAIAAVEGTRAPAMLSKPATKAMHWLATSNYILSFPPSTDLSERLIFPFSSIESHGLEDARFVRFVEDGEPVRYYATYTAFDGFRVLPELIETADFLTFRISTLSGNCAANKGAAIFPRKVGGMYMALSRYDGENNYVMTSDNPRVWETADKIEAPRESWALARVGNCGSPLETDAGWLVITHGVGPMREYSIGAMLLDLDDPRRVIGHLQDPLITPSDDGRDGYVPNVVYSCGSLIVGKRLVIPYGIADTAVRFARFNVSDILNRLTEAAPSAKA